MVPLPSLGTVHPTDLRQDGREKPPKKAQCGGTTPIVRAELRFLQLRNELFEDDGHSVCGGVGGFDDGLTVRDVIVIVRGGATMTSGVVLMPTASAPMVPK